MKRFDLPFRQIHLDFHTGPWVDDVGKDFDAKLFARTMKRAHVNSVTVFAKCHHGHLYYNTKRPERHPGLRPGLDLLAKQVKALHAEGIRAPIYISVQCDEYAADNHPEWIARDQEGRPIGAGPLKPGWQILDMSSPYQEFLADQTKEILARFRPVDGIFFDMCWDQPSLNNYAVEAMQAKGLDPEAEADRNRHAHEVALAYMGRFRRMVKASSPRATVFFNCRPFFRLREDIAFQEQVEIESLPTGGWGYIYFPKNVRYARTFDKPYMGMTARFHRSWADFGGLKPPAALEYETSQMIAHGARCSVGDQLHPRGTLDRAAYDLIGGAYKRVEDREPWVKDARPVADIGLFQVASGVLHTTQSTSGTDEGAVRMLTQLKCQFDVLGVESDISKYRLLILPDAVRLTPDLVRRIGAYLKNGGRLLATGTSGMADDGGSLLVRELPVKPVGMSPFTTTYFRFGAAFRGEEASTDHVMYMKGTRVIPLRGADVHARVVEPYFERSWRHFCSHQQTPADRVSRFAAAVTNRNCGYVAYPVFQAYAEYGNVPYRRLVDSVLKKLLPDPVIRVGAPTGTEVSVMRQGRRTIVHILQYAPERRAKTVDIVEDVVPLFDVPVSLKQSRAPSWVYTAPDLCGLAFRHVNGVTNVVVPEVRGHAMVVFE